MVAGTHVTVALDSPFNQVRVDLKGEPATPDAIVGLKHLVAAGHPNAVVNVVIAGEQMHLVEEVMSYLESQGAFDGVSSIQLSPLAPPIAHTEHANRGLSARKSGFNVTTECDAFSGKLIEYSGRYDLDMKGYASKVGAWMLQGGTPYRCPVAEWKWVATPNGDVYACHQLVGIDPFLMGNLHDEGWYNQPSAVAIRERFLERTTERADLCQSCVLKSTCMVFVDCPARSFLEMGDEKKVTPHYCQCGKIYLERLLAEQLIALFDTGQIAVKPLSNGG